MASACIPEPQATEAQSPAIAPLNLLLKDKASSYAAPRGLIARQVLPNPDIVMLLPQPPAQGPRE